MRRMWLFVLMVCVLPAPVLASPPKCVLFPLTTAGTESAVVSMEHGPLSWTVSLSQLGCADTHTSANVTMYGPRLDSAGNRGPGIPLVATTPTVNLSTWQHGSSIVSGVSVNPVAVPSPAALTCVGGTNNGAACVAASACPAGRCGPCAAFVAFCGENLNPDSP